MPKQIDSLRNIRAIGLLLGAFIMSAAANAETVVNTEETSMSPEEIREVRATQQAEFDGVPATSGSGPFPAVMEVDPGLPNHVVYRPRDLGALDDRKLGILIWGNGGCTNDGASAQLHLTEIASHGYFAVAPGRILSGPAKAPGSPAPTPMTTTATDMIRALDWVIAENEREDSPYFGRIDPHAVAFSGHSCGGILAIQISNDPRVRTLIIHNSGVFPNRPERPTLITDKAWLQDRLHSPILYVIGNETDVGHPVAVDDFAKISDVPVFLGELDVGHDGTFREPNGGLAAQAAVAWLEWRLRDDRRAARQFVGADCGLCRHSAWKVRRKGF